MKTSEILVCLFFGLGCLAFATWPIYRAITPVIEVLTLAPVVR